MKTSKARRENLVCYLAQHLGYGVVSIDAARAAEAHVPLGEYSSDKKGYYAVKGQPRTGKFLVIDEWSPGDGWTRYRLGVLSHQGSGEDHFSRSHGSTAQGFDDWLQGALASVEEIARQKQIKREKKGAKDTACETR